MSHTVLNINHDDEITDEERNGNDHYGSDHPIFDDDKKSLILHVLSNLKLGMDLTKVNYFFYFDGRRILSLNNCKLMLIFIKEEIHRI